LLREGAPRNPALEVLLAVGSKKRFHCTPMSGNLHMALITSKKPRKVSKGEMTYTDILFIYI
jgi:sulfite exporter TauE/SafE